MKKIFSIAAMFSLMFIATVFTAQTANAVVIMGNPTPLDFERYESYFEKNNSGLKGDKSFLMLGSQKQFDKVFGAAATMGQNSFLPDDAFKSKIVVAVLKRGNLRRYENIKVTTEKGKLLVWYDAADEAPSGATFSSPLILAVNKGKYKEVVFMENGKRTGVARLKK